MTVPSISLKGRNAIVTGGGDIGGAIARGLASCGAKVEVWDSSRNVRDSFHSDGIETRDVDITSMSKVNESMNLSWESHSQIDILVNSAAVAIFGPVATMSSDDWTRTMDVNLTGVFLTCQAFVKCCLRTGIAGNIVNISSIGGLRGEADFSNYCASKFGVIGFGQSLAREVGEFGIRVNTVCPGAVESRMNTETMARDTKRTGESIEDVEKRILAKTALRRLVKPKDVADAVIFLSSDLASCVTAETLSVTGGVF